MKVNAVDGYIRHYSLFLVRERFLMRFSKNRVHFFIHYHVFSKIYSKTCSKYVFAGSYDNRLVRNPKKKKKILWCCGMISISEITSKRFQLGRTKEATDIIKIIAIDGYIRHYSFLFW